MSNIKGDLARRKAVNMKVVEVELVDPLEAEDQICYEAELRKELQHRYERFDVS